VNHEFITTCARGSGSTAEVAGRSLAEKVEQVVQLQRIVLPQIKRRRALKPWEKVWELGPSGRR
jgi:hypothetical protein